MSRAVSTWSLHRTLGRFFAPDSAALGGAFSDGAADPDGLTLLELPAELRARGYDTVQIVHFHLPSHTPEYLADLRAALEAADIELDALLIDDGDLTDEANIEQIERWLDEWLGVAVALGAKRARLMAGRAEPTPERISASARRLVRLADSHPDVRIVTENWMAMMPDADHVQALLARTGDRVGLLIDLGNWRGADKYDQLARIAPLAETCHAKCHTTEAGLDADDFGRTLGILKEAGFDGPLALIYDGADDDEWAMLDAEYDLTRRVFA